MRVLQSPPVVLAEDFELSEPPPEDLEPEDFALSEPPSEDLVSDFAPPVSPPVTSLMGTPPGPPPNTKSQNQKTDGATGVSSQDKPGVSASALAELPLATWSQAQTARDRYRETLQRLSPDATLGPLLSLAVLAERLLTHAERDGAQKLLQQRIELTPLRKLWICWRCQRGLC